MPVGHAAPARRRRRAPRPRGPRGRRRRRPGGRRRAAGRSGSSRTTAARRRHRPSDPTICHAMLVWMDLEMTGLDPARHVIVEIATLVTDDDLEIVAEGPDLVVHQPPRRWPRWTTSSARCTPRSGLLAADRGVDVTLEEAGAPDARRSSRSTCPSPAPSRCAATRSAPTGASSPRYLPEIEDYLHYRSVDVSTIKELARRWYPEALDGGARARPAATGPSTTSARARRAALLPASTSSSRRRAARPAT